MNVCQLQSRTREPGFKSLLRNSTDDLPRYEQKQTNAISFPHLGQNTRQYFRFGPFLRRARLRPTVRHGSVPRGEAPPDIFHDIPWQGRFYWFLFRGQDTKLAAERPFYGRGDLRVCLPPCDGKFA